MLWQSKVLFFFKCPKIGVQEVFKQIFNSVINFRRVTHFQLCLLKTQGTWPSFSCLGFCWYVLLVATASGQRSHFLMWFFTAPKPFVSLQETPKLTFYLLLASDMLDIASNSMLKTSCTVSCTSVAGTRKVQGFALKMQKKNSDKVVELVGGGSVTNWAYPV